MLLGRLPHDPAALAAAPSLAGQSFANAAPKPVLDRSGIAYQPREFSNRTLPVCTVAGLANGMLAVSALSNWQVLIQDAMIPPFYASVVGCANTEAAIMATSGANVLDVLKAQLGGFDVGLQDPTVGLFGTLLPTNRAAIANAMDVLGFAYVGVNLYERDMDVAGAGQAWSDGASDPGGLIGGHLIILWDYLGLADDAMGRAATWGTLQPFTWGWLRARIQEAHGLAWRFLGTAGKLDANGDAQQAAIAAWSVA
jgi:hypothetical protein